jgi:hypothetical protein
VREVTKKRKRVENLKLAKICIKVTNMVNEK